MGEEGKTGMSGADINAKRTRVHLEIKKKQQRKIKEEETGRNRNQQEFHGWRGYQCKENQFVLKSRKRKHAYR